MRAEVASQFPYIWLTCFALLLFFSVFIGVLIQTQRSKKNNGFTQIERLPLEEEV
jgi:hypothetical protein